jgi:hypothetical protein
MAEVTQPERLYVFCEDCNEGREVFTVTEAEAWRQGHAAVIRLPAAPAGC